MASVTNKECILSMAKEPLKRHKAYKGWCIVCRDGEISLPDVPQLKQKRCAQRRAQPQKLLTLSRLLGLPGLARWVSVTNCLTAFGINALYLSP